MNLASWKPLVLDKNLHFSFGKALYWRHLVKCEKRWLVFDFSKPNKWAKGYRLNIRSVPIGTPVWSKDGTVGEKLKGRIAQAWVRPDFTVEDSKASINRQYAHEKGERLESWVPLLRLLRTQLTFGELI